MRWHLHSYLYRKSIGDLYGTKMRHLIGSQPNNSKTWLLHTTCSAMFVLNALPYGRHLSCVNATPLSQQGLITASLTHLPLVNFSIFNSNVLQRPVRQAPAAQDAAWACLACYLSKLWSDQGRVVIRLNEKVTRNPDLMSEHWFDLTTHIASLCLNMLIIGVDRNSSNNTSDHYVWVLYAGYFFRV